MVALRDFIDKNYAGNDSAFARAHNQHITQVKRWLKANAFLNGTLLCIPKCELVSPALTEPPEFGSKYWHLNDAATPGGEKLPIVAKYWVGDVIDNARLEVANVFNSEASARASHGER